MLVALSDTHGETDPCLTDYLREAVVSADCVCHAGDFTTAAVLDAFERLADRLVAVYGNSDSAASERVGDIPSSTLAVTLIRVARTRRTPPSRTTREG
ncbi:MAG: metallophosphoesterase family protein [Haloarculaceae archaeon]